MGKNGEKNADFLSINRYISETIKYGHTVTKLQYKINRKSLAGFRSVPIPMILNDPNRPYRRHGHGLGPPMGWVGLGWVEF